MELCWLRSNDRGQSGRNENQWREVRGPSRCQARTEANEREIISQMDAWIEGTETCVGKLEASREKSDGVAEHQEVPKEAPRSGNYWSTELPIWGPASSRRAPPTAAETDPE
jgi:hypothetical protein